MQARLDRLKLGLLRAIELRDQTGATLQQLNTNILAAQAQIALLEELIKEDGERRARADAAGQSGQ